MNGRLECFLGTDVWSGALRMFVPGLFMAEIYNDSEGIQKVRTLTDPEALEELYKKVIQNNLPYREAVISGRIYKDCISKKVVRKIERYLLAGETKKAENKVWGYSSARLKGHLDEISSVLEELDDLAVGRLEKKEQEPVMAYCYKNHGSYIFNISPNLSAILKPGGVLEINVRKEFIKGDIKRNILPPENDLRVKRFAISRGVLNDLERACVEDDKVLRDDILNEMINWAIPYLEEDDGD